jgi:hypothetical protein
LRKVSYDQKRSLQSGELSPRSFADYAAVCKRLIKAFGKTRLVADIWPDDFERMRATMADAWGPVRLGNEINRVRIVFSYAIKSGVMERPMCYGEGFKRPLKKVVRTHRLDQECRPPISVLDLETRFVPICRHQT